MSESTQASDNLFAEMANSSMEAIQGAIRSDITGWPYLNPSSVLSSYANYRRPMNTMENLGHEMLQLRAEMNGFNERILNLEAYRYSNYPVVNLAPPDYEERIKELEYQIETLHEIVAKLNI